MLFVVPSLFCTWSLALRKKAVLSSALRKDGAFPCFGSFDEIDVHASFPLEFFDEDIFQVFGIVHLVHDCGISFL